MVISYNESDWIELSIKSISDIVDEFIVVIKFIIHHLYKKIYKI